MEEHLMLHSDGCIQCRAWCTALHDFWCQVAICALSQWVLQYGFAGPQEAEKVGRFLEAHSL
jgi:hypothetical protein